MLDSNIGAKERERCLDCMVQQIFISFSPKKDAAYRPKSNSPMLKSKQYLTFIHFKIAYSLPIRLLAHRTAITVISCVNIVVHFVCIQLREKKITEKRAQKYPETIATVRYEKRYIQIILHTKRSYSAPQNVELKKKKATKSVNVLFNRHTYCIRFSARTKSKNPKKEVKWKRFVVVVIWTNIELLAVFLRRI